MDKLGRPPAILWIPAMAVAAALALPPAYLLLRTLGAGSEAAEILFRMRVLEILGRTFLLVGAVTGACIVLAVPLAWVTVRADLPLRRFWVVATALPLVIPSYVGALIVVVALGPRGMLQKSLEGPLGVERLPDIYGFPGAMLTLTFLSYPYVLLTVRAALLRLDPTLEQVSRGLGRTPWVTFFRVILPLLRPAIAGGGLLVALYTLSDFGAVSLLRYETFTWAIYLQYDSALDRTLAAALSLVLAAIALAIVAVEALTRGRAQYFRSGPGAAVTPGLVRLGRWRWAALALCATVTVVALALPLSILAYWIARGVTGGEQFSFLWTAVRNSLLVSVLAAGASVAAALPIVSLSVRNPSLLSTLLEKVSYIGFALPGIAVALALVFFGANYLSPLYQTTSLLILSYVILFVSPAVAAARPSFLQVGPSMEEAARSLGRTPLEAFATVTAPLVRPGIISGAALVFLLTMKELPATLILSPIGFKTLATSIWSATSEAFYARAAASGLLLILISSVPLALLMLRGRR